MKIPDGFEAKKLLNVPPTGLRAAYRPTCELAWFMGRNEEDFVLGQKWVSDYGTPEKWVRVRKYVIKEDGNQNEPN